MTTLLPQLKKWTQARIGLPRAGHSIGTTELLRFNLAHAMAKDAVNAEWNFTPLMERLREEGQTVLVVGSRAGSKSEYLKRPDLGRILNQEGHALIESEKNIKGCDVVVVVTDGLSAKAIEEHFLPFWKVSHPILRALNCTLAPIVLAPLSRVAIGDPIGELLQARASIVVVGERPGLSAPNSMGIYLTYGPKIGKQDSGRNCISNVRPPDGLSYHAAAMRLASLLRLSLQQHVSGVLLREEMGVSVENGQSLAELLSF